MTISETLSFKNILTGSDAFYKKTDYLAELQQKDALPASYVWNTEHKVARIAKFIFSIIIFPIGIYQLIHFITGKFILHASSYSASKARDVRHVTRESPFKYKRFTLEVDGNRIDALIMGKESTFGNGRWVLRSGGNGELYENTLQYNHNFKEILTHIEGNAIIFNYPGVGASSGFPNRKAMEKTYRAMLTLLENQEKGIGAKEIIGFGHSLGGGVQGDALRNHKLKDDVKYVFVKSKTFSNLNAVVSNVAHPILGFLIKVFGWNMDSVTSSKALKVPEIILQTAKIDYYKDEIINDGSRVKNDGIISADASLAKALLNDPESSENKKLFIGTKGKHNYPMDAAFLASKILDFLKS